MSGKKQSLYEEIFNYVKENVVNLECRSFMTDFETSMRNALQKTYPNVKIFACWFHYCQSLRRKINQLHLMPRIAANKQLKNLYFKFLCIPLLPEDKIEQAFNELSLQCNAVDRGFFDDFLKYFDRQWMRKVILLIFQLNPLIIQIQVQTIIIINSFIGGPT